MLEFSGLRELYEIIQARGISETETAARQNLAEVIEGLKAGLVQNFNSQKQKINRSFVFQFEVVIFPIGGGSIDFWLEYDHALGRVTAHEGHFGENPSIRLRADLGKMMYIISGTQRDSAVYRSRVLAWWKTQKIFGDGNFQLLQLMQGSF